MCYSNHGVAVHGGTGGQPLRLSKSPAIGRGTASIAICMVF